MLWLVVKFLGGDEKTMAVPSDWLVNQKCVSADIVRGDKEFLYWPPEISLKDVRRFYAKNKQPDVSWTKLPFSFMSSRSKFLDNIYNIFSYEFIKYLFYHFIHFNNFSSLPNF